MNFIEFIDLRNLFFPAFEDIIFGMFGIILRCSIASLGGFSGFYGGYFVVILGHFLDVLRSFLDFIFKILGEFLGDFRNIFASFLG